MTETLERFQRLAATWRPEPTVEHDILTPGPASTFAAMLDLSSPVIEEGDPLPPLWHWFFFLPQYRQASLGADGHPRDAAFLPPLEDRRRLFGGGRIAFTAPLRSGEAVTRTGCVASVRVRTGRSGPLLLVTIEYRYSADGEVMMVEQQDIVYVAANPRPHGVPPEPSDAGEITPLPDAPWVLTVRPDPVLLFRFSALTGNGHRIHYDLSYARDVEGHPTLVVHGPLLALLLLELPRRHTPDLRVTRLQWRARSPMYVDQRVHLRGCLVGGVATLAAADGNRRDAVVAEVRLATT